MPRVARCGYARRTMQRIGARSVHREFIGAFIRECVCIDRARNQ
jgi:hypothetical protein